ncbi:MAG: hypothetical protein HOP11_10850 [Saprospiraceae bacterium]|nr:hypothetical protein [Saprospiraceae bacterium]
MKDLTLKARQKAFDLGENLSKISDKNTSKETKRKLIDLTMDMFKDSDCVIEVTSLRDTSLVKKEKIRKYLNRIADFPNYSKVQLEWNQVHVISDIRKDEKGDYWGIIHVIQRFQGFGNNDEVLYKDVTEKAIEVRLEHFNVEKGAKLENYYVLKFGDVKVIETTDGKPIIKP